MVFHKWMLSTSAIALLGLTGLPSSVAAIEFPPSNRRGPARTASGGSRSTCFVERAEDGAIPMTALMPKDNFGTTVDEDPNLYLYIPRSRIDGGEVIVRDLSDDREVYLQQFDLSEKPNEEAGVVKLNLEGANLEPDKTYGWEFLPFCLDEEGNPEYIQTFVEGRFERTPLTPDRDDKLEQARTPLEKAELYARESIWNETLTILDQLRDANPREWSNLLDSVGLEEIANAPYLGEGKLMNDEDAPEETVLQNSSDREEKVEQSAPIEGLW